MDKIYENAWAKLNISLDVLSRLDDGYHAMLMVMQSCEFRDDLEITLTKDGSFRTDSNVSYIPNDERNLVIKAAKEFFAAVGETKYGADIKIEKRIPVCAGLGGGSSDAAAVLRALNTLTGAGLDADRLREIGMPIGADVPFCVEGGTSIAEGKGEILTPLPDLPDCHIVICKPDFAISTPMLFGQIDCDKPRNRPDTDGLIEALAENNLSAVAKRMYNVFEDVLPKRFLEVGAVRRKLLHYEALGAAMSGTGSAVFGLFDDLDKAQYAYEQLQAEYSATFLTRPSRKVAV